MCSPKFSLVTLLLLVLQDQTFGQLLLTSGDSQEGGLFGSDSKGEVGDGDSPGSPPESNGYLPPLGSEPSDDVPAFAKPPGSGQDDRPTNNQPQFIPPVTRQIGCAAALLCVEEQFCTMTGMISETPLQLTEAQKLRAVPMVDCTNPDNGVQGKCCRDPNYVDPWPAGGLLPVNYTGGFDEQGFPSYLNLSKKKPTQPSKSRPQQPQRPQQPLNLVPFPQQPAGSFLGPKPPARPLVPQQPFPQNVDSSEGSIVQPTFDSQRVIPGQPQPSLQPSPSGGQGSFQLGQGQQPERPGAIQQPRPFQLPLYPQQPQQPIGPGYPSSTPQPSNYDEDIQQPSSVRPGYPSSTPQPPKYNVDYQKPVQPSIRPSYPSSTPQAPNYDEDVQQSGQPQQPIRFDGYPSSTPQSSNYDVNIQHLGQPQQPSHPGYPSSTPQPSLSYPQPGQPIVIGQRPQGGKTFEVATYPEVPNQIPNQPYEDSQEIQSPSEVPVIPQGTSPRPGIYSGPTGSPYYPKAPAPIYNNGQGSLPNAPKQVAIVPHTPGSRCGILNQVQNTAYLREGEAAFGEIPWEAMILLSSEKKLLCSGAIVAPNLVLTAANCVYGINPADIMIKAGEYKLGFELKHEEPYPFQIEQVESVVTHPNYQPGSPGYDTALLYLQHPIKLDQHIDVICVSGEAPIVNPGRKCISVGWGKEILKLHVAGAVQNKIEVDVLGESECAQRVANAESPLDLHESLVCAKAHKQSSNMCMVDVGGPLACDRGDGTYEIVGVYSQDTGCLPTNQVATFALIDVNWVNDAIDGRAPQPQLQPQQSQQPQQIYQPGRQLQQPTRPQTALFDVLTPEQDQQQPIKTASQINYPGSVPAGLNQYLPPQ